MYRLNQEAQKAYEVKCSELKGLTAGYLDEADLARLENERHPSEKILCRHIADVYAADPDRSVVDVVKSRD